MARTITAAMQTSIAAEQATVVRFIELVHSGGTARWVTAAQDVGWDSKTWVAVGGVLQVGGASESADLRSDGIPVALSGVDGAITALVMTNSFRGYDVTVWRGHIDTALGTVIADPLLEFKGYQNSAYRITDDPRTEEGGGGTITIKTQWVSRLARLQSVIAVRTNLHSHRDLLRRAGLTGIALDDSIMRFVPKIAGNIRTIRWGSAGAPFHTGGGGSHDPDSEDNLF